MNNQKKRAVQRHIITLALSLILVFTPVTYISANAASSISAADVQTAVNYAVNWYNSGRLYYYYYCQAFVNQVWKESLGLSTSRCCAKNAYDVDLVSTSRDNIPVGASIYFAGGGGKCSNCGQTPGHVAFYIGNNEIIHVWGKAFDKNGNLIRMKDGTLAGSVLRTTINWVESKGYKYSGWGYNGGRQLESIVSTPAHVHSYNDKGYCSCGQEYPYAVNNSSFAGRINQKVYLKTRPYGAETTTRTLYKGDSVSIVAYTANHYGSDHIWYKTAQGDWVYCGSVDKVQTSTQKPSLSISGQNAPTKLNVGDNFGVRGIISTDCGTITKVYGAIINSSGTTVQSGSYSPNTASHNLQYSINNDLVFNKLPTGNYTYKVTATAVNGSKSTTLMLINSSFTVGSPAATTQKPSLSISGQNAPTRLNVGDNFGVRGIISTDCGTITRVYGAIINSSGTTVQSGSYSPNTASHNLQYSINNDLVFNKLPTGNYTYKVTATAANGSESTTLTLINSSFTVGSPAATTQRPSLSISGQNAPTRLNVGDNFGIRGIISTDCGTITRVYGAIINSSGTTIQSGSYSPNTASHNLQYSINNDLVFNNLSAGNYTYRVTATAVNGSESTTLTLINSSFTVGSPAAATENTRTGVVSIPSSWDNLSIRSGPSTNYSIVGSMNQGAVCTVYPDRAQNGWYYVNYNGVTGYASGNCINLR